MIVQPTPTSPPSRRVRARRVALLVPPVLLVLAVGAGFAGQRPAPHAGPTAEQASAVPGGSGAPDAGLAAAGIPGQFGDLNAMTPSADLDGDTRLAAADAVAVEGYLGVDPAQSGCFDTPGSPFGPWCDRRGILAVSPWGTSGTAPFPSHLRVHIPVGVRLPEVIENGPADRPSAQVPVLVVGRRSVPPAACDGWGPVVCDDELEIDRVAWADGVRTGLTPLIDPRLSIERRPNPFMNALDAADSPLLGVLVWPEDVWRLDTAAGEIASGGAAGQPVWYLRVLDGARSPGMERQVRWMLLAEPDLRVLASGRPGEAATASLDGG